MEMEAIYENIQEKNRNTVGLRTPTQNPTEAQSNRRWFVVITACLGLICVLLVVALILLYMHLTAERDQVKMTYMNIVEKCNKALKSLKVNYSHLTDDKNSLMQKNLESETNYNHLIEERNELQKNFDSVMQKKLELKNNNSRLIEERDQLQMNLTSISQMKMKLEARVEHLSEALMKSISGSCRYFLSNEEKNWTDSRQFCKDHGGDLLIIDSEEEQKYISSIVKENVWIGLSDIEMEGNMTWVDNTPLNKGFWYQGEPNNYNENEDCVEIWISKMLLNNWNDARCSVVRKWICEN